MIKATTTHIDEMIADDTEWKEILRDLINGDYTVEALQQDFEEWVDARRSFYEENNNA